MIDFDEKSAIGFGSPPDEDDFGSSELNKLNSAFDHGALAFLQHIGSNWIGWKLTWDERGGDAFAAHLRKRNIADIAVQPDSHPPETTKAIEYDP